MILVDLIIISTTKATRTTKKKSRHLIINTTTTFQQMKQQVCEKLSTIDTILCNLQMMYLTHTHKEK